jgi:hypothetical protein
MAIGSGIASQIGMKPEASWGTYIAPDRFFEFDEAESLKANWRNLDTQGFGDVYLRSGRNRVWIAGASGTVPMPFMENGCGILLKHMLGAAAAPTGSGPYTHVFTSSVAGLNTLSMTVQKGVPDTGGTVRPFSFVGGVVTEWNIICEIDQNVRLSTVWDFKDVTTAEALATASYPATNSPFSFIDGTCEIDDVAVNITRCRLHGMNRFNVDRRSFGNTKRRQIPNGAIGFDGEIRMEFESLDEYNKFLAGTESKLDLIFAYGTSSLTIEIPKIQYTGDTPVVESQDIVPLTLPFRVLYSGSGSPLTMTLVNDDATP